MFGVSEGVGCGCTASSLELYILCVVSYKRYDVASLVNPGQRDKGIPLGSLAWLGQDLKDISTPGARTCAWSGVTARKSAGARSVSACTDTWREQVQHGFVTRRRISSHHSSHCTNTFL